MRQHCEPFVAVEWVACLAFFDEPRIASLHIHTGSGIFVAGEIDMLRLWDELLEKFVERMRPLNPLNAGELSHLFFGELRAFPHGDVVVRFPHEEDFTLLRIDCVRHQDQHGFFLIDTGEIV